jgi:hypothetical protein
MTRISGVTTVPGTVDGRGNRTVAYTLIKDDGTRQALTLDVSGDRQRVRQLLAAYYDIPADNITFDPHYE